MPTRIPNAERSRRTRRALLDAAQELFAERGDADTSTEEVARRAAVTRGALSYHFRDKIGLFAAVYEEQNVAAVQAIAERIQEAEGDLWQRVVVTMCRISVERAVDPRVQRILYVDGPAVLGRASMEKIGPGLEFARQAFESSVAVGVLKPLPSEPVVYLLWALSFEAGLYIASAADPARAREEMLSTLLEFFNGLQASPSSVSR